MEAKPWIKSKTIALMVVGGVIAILSSNELANVIPTSAGNLIALLIFVLGIVVRFLTTGPITLETPPTGGDV